MTGESWPTGGTAVADGIAQVAAPTGGLSAAEAADRLARYGPNELPRARRTPAWRLAVGQLRDPLILVLLAAVGKPHPPKGIQPCDTTPISRLSA